MTRTLRAHLACVLLLAGCGGAAVTPPATGGPTPDDPVGVGGTPAVPDGPAEAQSAGERTVRNLRS